MSNAESNGTIDNKENEGGGQENLDFEAMENGDKKLHSSTALDVGYETTESAPRVQSPRKVKDIHLDGSADNMPNVDPYMLDDKDLDIHSEAGGHAGSVYSDLSGRSWKSLRTPRTKPHSATSSHPRSSIASRARQIKDHEGEPFLSIDLLPQSSATRSEPKPTGTLRSSLRGSSCQTLVSAVSSESMTQKSGKNIANRAGKPRVLSASSYSSPVKQPPKPNHHVKMPFKQTNVSKTSVIAPSSNSQPGQGLTERTALATHVFHKALREQKPSKTTYIQGRLLKARLKPLEPVQNSGPTIHQCRGIVAETRSYAQSHSRTFQRWKAIMAGGATAHQHLHHSHLPDATLADIAMATSNGVADPRVVRAESACESVHQTSQASSSSSSPTPRGLLNDNVELDGLDNSRLPSDPHDMSSLTLTGEEQANMQAAYDRLTSELKTLVDQRNLNYSSLPASPPGPVHCEENIADLCGPDFQGLTPQASRLGMSPGDALATGVENVQEREPAGVSDMRYAEGIGDIPPAVSVGVASVEKYGSESVISGSVSFQPSDKGDNSSALQQAATLSGRRPQSASYPQKPALIQPAASRRPKTAVDASSSSRKAVRFADKPEHRAEVLAGRTEASNTRKGKNSCRPQSLDSGFHDRDEPEDGRGKPRGSNTFITQQNIQTQNGSTNQSDSSSQQNGMRESSVSERKASSKAESSKHKCEKGSNSLASEKESFLTTLEKAYSLNSASLHYIDDLNKNRATKKQRKNSGKGRKGLASDVKQKLDDRFAMYQTRKGALNKGNTMQSCQAGAKKEIKEAEGEGKTGDEDEREPFDKETELRQVVKKFFKPADYSASTHRTVRPQSSQSRKAKALKLLREKTRSASARPFSASTYSDREIVEKKSISTRPGKDLPRKSAEMFAEKTDILSKHGLLKSHGNNLAASVRPSSGSYTISPRPKEQPVANTEEQVDVLAADDEIDELIQATPSEARATYSASSRPKSGSRVTFASRNEYEGQPSNARELRARNHKSVKPRLGSAIYQDSCRTVSSGFGDDGMLDADLMWQELASDDSDSDCDRLDASRNDAKDRELVAEEDFFMAKFDLLNLQFEAAKAELRQENLKSAMKQKQQEDHHHQHPKEENNHCLVSQSPIQDKQFLYGEHAVVLSTFNNSDDYFVESQTPHQTSVSQSVFLTHPGDALMNESHDTENLGSGLAGNHKTREKLGESHNSKIQVLEKSLPVMAVHQRTELAEETTLSTHLYEKTHVCVEATPRHKNRPGSGSQSKAMFSKTTKVIQSKQENVSDEKEKDSENVLLSCKPEPKIENQAKESEIRKQETWKEMQRDYPLLLGIKVDLQLPKVTAEAEPSFRNYCEEVKFGADSAGCIEENASEYGNYQEMLLAYRRHCIEGSDESNSDAEENTFTRLARPKCLQGSNRKHQSKASVRSNKDGNGRTKSLSVGTSKPEAKTRPVSATTVDSGWESDCQPSSPVDNPPEKIPESTVPATSWQSVSDVTGLPNDTSAGHSNGLGEMTSAGDPVNPERIPLPGEHLHEDQTQEKSTVLLRSDSMQAQDSQRENSSDGDPLEIVAHAKKLSRKASDVPDEDPASVLSQVPPLCFRLNARPPEGFLYYFAYGPNMSSDRLCTYLQSESPPLKFWALLFGFGLVFNKKGSDATACGGFPNLEYNRASSVEGCIFQLTPAQLERLDAFMDYPRTHEHVVLPVWMSNSSSLSPGQDLGVAQYCVPAVTYIAQDEATWTDPVQANEFSVDQCVRAAGDTCSSAYTEHLASFSPVTQQVTQPLAIAAA